MISNLKITCPAILLIFLSALTVAACATTDHSVAVAKEDKSYKGDKLQPPTQLLSGFIRDLGSSQHIPDTNFLNRKYKFQLRRMPDGSYATQDISYLRIFLGNFISDTERNNTRRLEFEFDVRGQSGPNGPPFALPAGWRPAGGYSPNSTKNKPEPNLCLIYENIFGLQMTVCPSLYNVVNRIVIFDNNTSMRK